MAQVSGKPTDSFVGREREMAELSVALDQAAAGKGSLVLLTGEPGIGKTRTSQELATLAAERGAAVMWGRCVEQRGAPSFWPWSQIVREFIRIRDVDTAVTGFGHGASRVASGIPEIGELFPGFEDVAHEAHSAESRFLLFDAFASFLRNISEDHPIVLIIDNLHWADGASLDLLEFISPDLSGIPVLIVGTYRDVEVSRRHPLSKVLANLNRDRSFQRISLGGLNEAEVDRLVTEGVGRSLSVEAMRSLHDRADGNPFFVREFIRLASTENKSSSWASESGSEWWIQIPEGVREVIGHRLDSLSDDCNRVLSLAAVYASEHDIRLDSRS